MGGTQTVGPVVFDYTWWQQRYPELSEWCNPGVAQGYFDLATVYCDNTPSSPVRDIPTRQILLGLLTAHIAALNAPLGGQPPSTLVGRISNASEGSVSVAVEYPMVAGQEWYAQTRYGSAYWAATSRFRMARYYPGPQPFREGGFWGRGRF